MLFAPFLIVIALAAGYERLAEYPRGRGARCAAWARWRRGLILAMAFKMLGTLRDNLLGPLAVRTARPSPAWVAIAGVPPAAGVDRDRPRPARLGAWRAGGWRVVGCARRAHRGGALMNTLPAGDLLALFLHFLTPVAAVDRRRDVDPHPRCTATSSSSAGWIGRGPTSPPRSRSPRRAPGPNVLFVPVLGFPGRPACPGAAAALVGILFALDAALAGG
jgi:hypothetical protein